MERSAIEMFEKSPVTLFIYATYALFSAMMVLEKRRRSGDIIGLLRENKMAQILLTEISNFVDLPTEFLAGRRDTLTPYRQTGPAIL